MHIRECINTFVYDIMHMICYSNIISNENVLRLLEKILICVLLSNVS